MYVVVKEDETLPVKVLLKVESSKLLLGIYCCDHGVLIIILEAELFDDNDTLVHQWGRFQWKGFQKTLSCNCRLRKGHRVPKPLSVLLSCHQVSEIC